MTEAVFVPAQQLEWKPIVEVLRSAAEKQSKFSGEVQTHLRAIQSEFSKSLKETSGQLEKLAALQASFNGKVRSCPSLLTI